MANKVQKAVRLQNWILEAVDEEAEKRRINRSDMVNILLGWELEELGHSEAKYNQKKYGIGRKTAKKWTLESDSVSQEVPEAEKIKTDQDIAQMKKRKKVG